MTDLQKQLPEGAGRRSYRQELVDAARRRIAGKTFSHEALAQAPAGMDVDTLLLLLADALDPMVPRLQTTTGNAQVYTNVIVPLLRETQSNG